MSFAARFYAFKTRTERDAFVAKNDKAEAFTKRGLRALSLGSSVANFEESVRYAECCCDNN